MEHLFVAGAAVRLRLKSCLAQSQGGFTIVISSLRSLASSTLCMAGAVSVVCLKWSAFPPLVIPPCAAVLNSQQSRRSQQGSTLTRNKVDRLQAQLVTYIFSLSIRLAECGIAL